MIGEDLLDIERIDRKMDAWVSGHHSAKAAIGVALPDIAGKLYKVPIHKLLGGSRRTEAPRLGAIPLGAPQEMTKRAVAWIEKRWPRSQMKLGFAPP